MKILISNDDGVYAPGIKILKTSLDKLSAKILTIAPLEERSTTGHTLSLDNPLRLIEISENNYGCSGYPADCTLMGIGYVFKDQSGPDLVVSGINRGANLGQDIYYSGTVAAAREATFHGVKSIAVSSVIDFNEHSADQFYFETAGEFVFEAIKRGIVDLIPPMSVININVPNRPIDRITGVELTTLGFRSYSEQITKRKDFRNRDYYWIGGIYKGFKGEKGTDCFAIDKGKISVSILNLLGEKTDESKEWSNLITSLNELFNKN